MPTTDIQIIEVRQKPDTNNVIFTARSNDLVITREIDISEFDTWEIFAQWVINQRPEFILLPEKQVSLNIEWHIETDPEGNTTRVVDNVIVN